MKSNLLGSTHSCQVMLIMFSKVVLSSKPVDANVLPPFKYKSHCTVILNGAMCRKFN